MEIPIRQSPFLVHRALSALFLGGLLALPAGAQTVSVLTQHNGITRSGSNSNESTLNTSNVNVNQFGKLFSRTVDGQIYAQPLYVPSVTIAGKAQNVVYAATMHNSVYAFDADNPSASAPLWHVNLGASVPTSTCDDTQPEYGVLSTPVINTSTNTIYLVARTTESGGSILYRLHALDITTGAEKPNSPVVIQASVPGIGTGSVNGTITFDPTLQLNRPGLLLSGSYIYLGFGSMCDGGNYHGWVMAYDATALTQKAVFNTTSHGGHGGVWQGGDGLAADSSGNIYLVTGDGSFDANQPGGFDYGDTFMKFSPALSVLDWFTPYNYSVLQQHNLDLGTGAPLLFPGTTYMIGGGKQGVIYVVNTTNMGHLSSGNNNNQIVQSFQATNGGEIKAAPIAWTGPSAQYLYVWGQGDPLKQFEFSGGQFVTTPIASSAAIDPGDPSGGEPLSVSSNGATSGTGILWASGAVNLNTTPPPGILRAYDATNVGVELWDSYQNQSRDDFGLFAKFAAPTIANGKVYLATFSNQLVVYGLLSNSGGPTVTAESPASGATGVAVTTPVTATFSTAMNASTITTGTFTLAPSGGSPISATVSYNSTSHVATLTPSASLANSTTYTATVVGGSSGVKDTSGNALAANFTWTFTTAAATSPPTVTSESPASGATGVAVTTAVAATFSTAMNASTITTSTFTLAPSGGSPVAASVSYNSTTNTATLTPSASLSNSTTYTATVVGGSNGVKSSSGLAMTATVTWSFTTAAASSPPTVTAESPASGATGVPITTTAAATFSTAMNASTVTTSTFTLAPSGGSPVAATVSYDSTTNTATLTPSASLANSTTYTATVVGGSNGVKSSSGLAMTANVTWSFTTGSGSSPIPTAGLGVWLRADAGITLNGSTVSQWADQSGNANTATQPVASAQPALVTGAINALPAVSFGGSQDMQFNLPVDGLTGMSIFLVNANAASFTGGGGNVYNCPLFWNETANNGTVYLSPFEQYVKWEFGTGQASNMPSYTRPVSIGTAFTMTDVVKNGTTENLYVGGTLVSTQTGKLSTIADTQSTGNLGVGYLNTHWQGQIAEVIVYTVALTDSQRQQVEQYLTAKYFPGGSPAPTVTAESPASGATGVATSTSVTATLSTAMNASTITASTFTLAPPGGSPVAATVSYNSGTNTATLTPSASLANSTTYTATVVGGSSGVKSSSGLAMSANVTWSFTTAAASSPPTVTAEGPASGATGVAVTTTATATFSMAMNASTITTSTFTLAPSGGSPVAATVSYNSGTNTATLTPSASLASSTTYTATVVGGSSGVKSSSGLAMSANVTWSFTTAAASSPPTVTAESPASGATGVPITTAATATFSTAMNASTITTSTFTLAPSGGSPVAATVSYNSSTNTAILTPSASLASSTTYTVTVVGGGSGVKSSSGLAMTASVTWSFTTASGSSPIPTTGLRVWLKADAGITLNGSAISQWADQSGNGNNAIQPVTSAQPAVVSGAINGLPAVNFGGSADMQFNLPVDGLTGMSIFLVNANAASFTGGGGNVYNCPLFWNETANNGTVYLSPFEQYVKWEFGTGQASNMPSYTRPVSIGTAFTMTDVVKNGTTENLYVGGTLVSTQTGKLSTIADTQSTGNLGVGYLNTHWQGQIAEVIVYTVALTDSQRQQVEQYLKTKYGL